MLQKFAKMFKVLKNKSCGWPTSWMTALIYQDVPRRGWLLIFIWMPHVMDDCSMPMFTWMTHVMDDCSYEDDNFIQSVEHLLYPRPLQKICRRLQRFFSAILLQTKTTLAKSFSYELFTLKVIVLPVRLVLIICLPQRTYHHLRKNIL
jgi:hypothetical protein